MWNNSGKEGMFRLGSLKMENKITAASMDIAALAGDIKAIDFSSLPGSRSAELFVVFF